MMTTILICYIPAGLIFILFCGITGLLDLPVIDTLSDKEQGYLFFGMVFLWPLVILSLVLLLIVLILKTLIKAAPYWSVVPRFLFGTVKFWVMLPARMTAKER